MSDATTAATDSASVAGVRLEPLSEDHLDGIMTWVNDPEVTFYFADLSRRITREEEARFVRDLIASDKERIFSIFGTLPARPEAAATLEAAAAEDAEGIATRAPESLPDYIGQIGLSKIYWPARNARLGIMLPRYAWGCGVAQAATRALLEIAFDELDLHKVWLIVRCSNARGLYLWTKLGFQCEGILRDEYYSRGRFHDMMRMSILRDDLAASAAV